MSNLLIDGVIKNPTVEEVKREFADKNIDWDKPICIQIHDKYFNVNDGVLDITRISAEPYFNKQIDGKSQQIRYFEAEATRNNGGVQVKTYLPGEVSFGKQGAFFFDFSAENGNPDTSLFRWLMLNPRYGTDWKLKLPEVESSDWLDKEKKLGQVMALFMQKNAAYITDEKLIILASQMQISNPQGMGINSLRRMLLERAKADPDAFLRMYGSKEFELIGLVQEAEDLKIIVYNRGKQTWHYTYNEDPNDMTRLRVDSDNALHRVRPHMVNNPKEDLAWFLSNVDKNNNIHILNSAITNRKADIVGHPTNKHGDTPEGIKKFASKMQIAE